MIHCVVLDACELGVWDALTSAFRIALPETVVGEVVQKMREEQYDRYAVDIERDVRQDRIAEPSLNASELRIVRELSGTGFRGVWDAGELECVACLLHERHGCSKVCSSDKVVYRFLGWVQKPELGTSLEELLHRMGSPRRGLPQKLTKDFREHWTARGFQEAFQAGRINL